MKILRNTLAALVATSLLTGLALAGDKEKGKGNRKNKEARIAAAEALLEAQKAAPTAQFDLGKVMEGLGIDGDDVARMAQSLQGENGEALMKAGLEAFKQMQSGEGGKSFSFDLAPMFGEDGELSIDLSKALSAALKQSTDGDSPKAGITMMGKGVIIGPDGKRHEIDFGKDGKGMEKFHELKKGLFLELDDKDGHGLGLRWHGRHGDQNGQRWHRGFHSKSDDDDDGDEGEDDDEGEEDDDDDDDDATAEALRAISDQLDLQTKLLMKLIEKMD